MPTNQKGIPKQRWTEEEIAILRKNYPVKGKMATAKLLNKTEAQVRDKASRLGLKVQKGTEFWME